MQALDIKNGPLLSKVVAEGWDLSLFPIGTQVNLSAGLGLNKQEEATHLFGLWALLSTWEPFLQIGCLLGSLETSYA